jgi:hypothetical protein
LPAEKPAVREDHMAHGAVGVRLATALAFALWVQGVDVRAIAAPILVASYAMNNGDHGSFDYRDFTYLPCPAGACATSGAPLSGGTGKLTDGVSPLLDWFEQGELTQWVGWDSTQGQLNPVVTFNFSSVVTVDRVTIWVSNSNSGGVAQPASITIGTTNFVIPEDTSNLAPRALTFTGLGDVGSSLSVEFFQRAPFNWVMVGEVSFDSGTVAVPEPASALLLGPIALGLVLARRRSAQYRSRVAC